MLKIANAKVDVTPDDRGWIFFSRPSDPQPARDPLFARLFLQMEISGEHTPEGFISQLRKCFRKNAPRR